MTNSSNCILRFLRITCFNSNVCLFLHKLHKKPHHHLSPSPHPVIQVHTWRIKYNIVAILLRKAKKSIFKKQTIVLLSNSSTQGLRGLITIMLQGRKINLIYFSHREHKRGFALDVSISVSTYHLRPNNRHV